MRIVLTIFLIIWLLSGCKENKLNYYYISLTEPEGKIKTVGEYNNSLESGKFLFYDDDRLISTGNFVNGQKKGEWSYHLKGDSTITIDWDIFKNKEYKFSISFPKEWYLFYEERPFQAVFDSTIDSTTIERSTNKCFIVYKRKLQNFKNLQKYNEMYNANTLNTFNDVFKDRFRIVSPSNTYFFSTYTYEWNSHNYITFNFICEHDNCIYDFTYSSLNRQFNKKFLIFFDMIRSCFIDQTRIFPPFNEYSVEKL